MMDSGGLSLAALENIFLQTPLRRVLQGSDLDLPATSPSMCNVLGEYIAEVGASRADMQLTSTSREIWFLTSIRLNSKSQNGFVQA